jgi:predicted  nucleic acid-binding Zn-ribbon protein
MLNPEAAALDREETMALLQELQELERRLWTLRHELKRLLDDA